MTIHRSRTNVNNTRSQSSEDLIVLNQDGEPKI